MIFKEWQKILSGEQTQARVLVKPGEEYETIDHGVYRELGNGVYRAVYCVGQMLAVQPAPGKYAIHYRVLSDGKIQIWNKHNQGVPTFIADMDEWKTYRQARIEIMDIQPEDVRHITLKDAKASGFDDEFEFMRTWVAMHDKVIHKQQYWGMKSLLVRPADRYNTWVLTFRLVQP